MRAAFFLVLRIAAGGVFVVSGFLKLIEPYQNFLAVIYGYKVISGGAARAAAIVMPWFELALGVFVVLGLWLRASVAGLWLLNTVFIGVVAQAMIRRLPIEDCGCFGEGAGSLPLTHVLLLDIALWLVFALLFFRSKEASFLSLDRYFERR